MIPYGYTVCCVEIFIISDLIGRRLISFAASKPLTPMVSWKKLHRRQLWSETPTFNLFLPDLMGVRKPSSVSRCQRLFQFCQCDLYCKGRYGHRQLAVQCGINVQERTRLQGDRNLFLIAVALRFNFCIKNVLIFCWPYFSCHLLHRLRISKLWRMYEGGRGLFQLPLLRFQFQ